MMKKLIGFALLSTLIASPVLVMGDDNDDEGGGIFGRWFSESRLDVAPVTNELYREECGSCHFAYQPGLLPARSWQQIMHGLEEHFEENAELGSEDQQSLLNYLTSSAADNADHKRSRSISNSLGAEQSPLRISDTLYFKRKHNEIPLRFVERNEKVGSYSRCEACHQQAERGSYNEDEVLIPGVGRWDD